jgi:hypothetical protein
MDSLSKTIIYGTDKEVANFLKKDPPLNELDEYGYTPLIQTAIVNSVAKAKLLLDAGANVDFTDLTNRTALFWAADNNNHELCNLLLKFRADPNSYTSGGQPVLVMPLLKKEQDVKQLLISAGAKLDFAQDFLNAKTIGHGFELEGRVDIVDTQNTFIEVEYEGFYLRFTLEMIANSLLEFKNNFAAKHMRKYFAKLNVIIHALQNAIELLRFQHYLIHVESYLSRINSLLETDPLILPISFGGHAITLIKFWDWFIRCDRGQYGRDNGTVIYYAMANHNRLDKAFCRELLYKRQDPAFINEGMLQYLGLEKLHTLSLPPQVTGNCSWANAEAVIPALMYLLIKEETSGDDKAAEEESTNFYYSWRDWNKTRSLDFCLQSMKEANISRQAAKAALLASILYQTCTFENQEDRAKANKILSVLSQPQYVQVLKCYVKVFSKDPTSAYWVNFTRFIDDFGIDIERLKM